MRAKPLWEISLTIGAEAEEVAAELMTKVFGSPASSYLHAETRLARVAVFSPKKPVLNLATRSELMAGMVRLNEYGLQVGAPKLGVRRLRAVDWAEAWKRHFKPLEIGSALLIKPSWRHRLPKKNQAVVILDPGLSFGTGQHPTTAFCLRQIVRYRPGANRNARSFLDVGSGSGILAICAAKLGFAPVHAFDFDPMAVRVARENARRNQVLARVRIRRGNVEQLRLKRGRKYSLVCANLIANLLIAQRRRIINQLAPDGVLVVAGILDAEFNTVRRAYESLGMAMGASVKEKEWRSACFVCCKLD
jgi:ribosomal protein L11 methyltransferase